MNNLIKLYESFILNLITKFRIQTYNTALSKEVIEQNIVDKKTNLKEGFFANLLIHNPDGFETAVLKSQNEYNILTDLTQLRSIHKNKKLIIVLNNMQTANSLKNLFQHNVVLLNNNFELTKENIDENDIFGISIDTYDWAFYYKKHNILFLNTGRLSYLKMLFKTIFFSQAGFLLSHIISLNNTDIKVTEETLAPPDEKTISLINEKLQKETILSISDSISNVKYDKKRFQYIEALNTARKRIEEYYDNIQNYEKELYALENRAKEQHLKNDLSNLISMLNRNSMIKDFKVYNQNETTLTIEVNTKEIHWNKIDYTHLQKIIDSGGGPYINKPRFLQMLEKVAQQKADLFFSPYNIFVFISEKDRLDYNLRCEKSELRNPHEQIGCMGGYNRVIDDARTEGNVTGLILALLEFLKHVTLGDGGSNDLYRNCIIKNKKGEIIYHGPSDQNKSRLVERNEEVEENTETQTPTEIAADDDDIIEFTDF